MLLANARHALAIPTHVPVMEFAKASNSWQLLTTEMSISCGIKMLRWVATAIKVTLVLIAHFAVAKLASILFTSTIRQLRRSVFFVLLI